MADGFVCDWQMYRTSKYIHQANMVDKNNKQYKRNQTIIA